MKRFKHLSARGVLASWLSLCPTSATRPVTSISTPYFHFDLIISLPFSCVCILHSISRNKLFSIGGQRPRFGGLRAELRRRRLLWRTNGAQFGRYARVVNDNPAINDDQRGLMWENPCEPETPHQMGSWGLLDHAPFQR